MTEEIEVTFKGANLLVEFTSEQVDDIYQPHSKIAVNVLSAIDLETNKDWEGDYSLLATDVATRLVDDMVF